MNGTLRGILNIFTITNTSAGYYSEPAKVFVSCDTKYYDEIEIITKQCPEARELYKSVHIVFITASEAYYEKFREEHFPEPSKINYIQKPIANEELVQIVNTIVLNSITID
jgi:two-component SAPR family response regulator